MISPNTRLGPLKASTIHSNSGTEKPASDGSRRRAEADANIYHSLNGQRVVGNENSVIFSNVWNEMDVLPLADQQCKKYGKSARFKAFGGARAAFDCT
jgi:hypothetical protein